MQREAVRLAISKANLENKDIRYVLGGDLLNQCIGAGFGLRELNIPFFGIYGACSTMIEGISLGSMIMEGGFADYISAVTSSHFCTAERHSGMVYVRIICLHLAFLNASTFPGNNKA